MAELQRQQPHRSFALLNGTRTDKIGHRRQDTLHLCALGVLVLIEFAAISTLS